MHRLVSVTCQAALAACCVMSTMLAMANMGAEESESTDPNFQLGKRALESQDWKRAIELLTKAVQGSPNNSDAHSMLGYAYRKNGNMDASFEQYGEALKLDPNNKHAHEYVGEAYLMTNDLPKAEQHLAELQRLCSPIPCEELKELKRAVDAYKKTKK
ncbi:MAG TPA: tetratricopeptide repeat protein [Burkholderiales bacterium]|nr:tetratricopeptide repeat protein [Burkholderiales bacterium]